MRGIAGFCLFTFLFYPWFFAIAQPAEESQREFLLQLSKEAVQHYQNGDLEAATFRLNQILLAKPTDQEALRLRETVGNEMLIQMLMKGGEIARASRALLLYAERAPIRRETNPTQIRNWVHIAASSKSNLYQRHDAIVMLEAQVGELAVPEMLAYLSSRTQDTERINILLTSQRLGRSIVIPLLETLQSQDYFLRQQVVVLLGHIGSKLALPELKRIVEDPREIPETKKYAQEAIQRITGKPAAALPASKVLFYQKALAYYNDDPDYRPISSLNFLYWRWQDNRLVSQEVPDFMYNKIMAEHTCYKSLEVDATYQKALALLIRVYYAQYTEIQGVIDAQIEKGIHIPKDDLEKFLQQKPLAQKARYIAASAGPEILLLALKDALAGQNQRPEVTVKIIEDIGTQYYNRGEIFPSLIMALQHSDKRIRYAAAEAIAKMSPTKNFPEANQVIQILQEAMGEWDSRTILVIDDDDAVRNKLIDIIRKNKWEPASAATGLDGLVRAKSFPPEDILIISMALKDMSASEIINSLQNDFQTENMPFLIVCEEKPKPESRQLSAENIRTLYKNVSQFKGVITKPLAPIMVEKILKQTMLKTKSGYKKRANEIALRAVTALASIQPNNILFRHLPTASSALIRVAEERHDAMKLPAMSALGNLADKKAVSILHSILIQKDNTPQIRWQAAYSLGQIYNKNQIKLTDKEVTPIISILDEVAPSNMKDETGNENKQNFEKLQEQVYHLLGQCNLGPELRRGLFEQHRIHKTIAVKAVPTTPTENIELPPEPDLPTEPGETTPGETTPGETTPGETTPGETTPGETTPGETTPGETTPGETTPGETTPGETTPGETTPGETIPGETIPGETIPGETIPGETIPGETENFTPENS